MKTYIKVSLMILVTFLVVGFSYLNKINERRELAVEFFKSENISPDQYLKSIDFTKPVKIYHVNEGDFFAQYQIPRATQGNFYALEISTPSQLGISMIGYDKIDKTNVTKEHRIYIATRNFEVLSSYAAPIIDDWSTPEIETQTSGTALQFFTTCKSCFKFAGVYDR